MSSVRGNFNSIKVQLKLVLMIKAFVISLFQFHKGTIKTCIGKDTEARFCDFNSIKVQLKPLMLLSALYLVTLFQFHKGTIKTRKFMLT